MVANRETIGYISSFFIHATIFLGLSVVAVHPAQYGVKVGLGNMEIDLVAVSKPEETFSSDEILSEPDALSPEKLPVSKSVKPRTKEKLETLQSSGSIAATPNYFQNPAPPYPELARSMRQEGLVMLLVQVDRMGKPTKVEIEKSSSYSLLDQAALKAVSHWKFQPAQLGGLTIDSRVEVPIRFRLDE